jgi:type VI protein secretion system component VasF
MTHNQKIARLPGQVVHNPAYRQAFQRLDEALEQNTGMSQAEKIAAMRKAYFADVEEFEKSGKLVLPE